MDKNTFDLPEMDKTTYEKPNIELPKLTGETSPKKPKLSPIENNQSTPSVQLSSPKDIANSNSGIVDQTLIGERPNMSGEGYKPVDVFADLSLDMEHGRIIGKRGNMNLPSIEHSNRDDMELKKPNMYGRDYKSKIDFSGSRIQTTEYDEENVKKSLKDTKLEGDQTHK